MPPAHGGAGDPGRMRAAGDTFGQLQFAHRTVCQARSVEHQTVGGVGIHISGQRDQISVILGAGPGSRRHRGFAAIDALGKPVMLLGAGEHVMADQAVEQEPPGFGGGRVGIAVRFAAVAGIDRPELGDAVAQRFLGGGPGPQIQSPAV